MPGFDRTGPFGAGPRSGRGMGLCGPYGAQGIHAPVGGYRGVGRGFAPRGGGRGRCFGGRGAGIGWQQYAGPSNMSPTEETELLKAQLAATEEQIAALKARLDELTGTG